MDGFPYEDFSLFISALKFSAEKHRGQRRKDAARTPYLNHPVEVAELLWRVGGVRDMPVLVAALLHDVVEDTAAGPDEVRELFGERVASIVREVTDDKSLPKAKRKELQILHAPDLSPGAGLIKIADKICNVRDITWSPPPDWSPARRREYFSWAEDVVDRIGTCDGAHALKEVFRQVLAEGRSVLAGMHPEH